MRLKHYMMLLLGLPIVGQLLSGYFLFDQLHRLDEAAKREADAKAIIATCQDLRVSVSKIWLWAGAQRFMNNENAELTVDEFANTANKKITELTQQVKGDSFAEKQVREYGDELMSMKELLKDSIVKFDESANAELRFARFMTEGEFLEEFFVRTSAIFKYEREIIAHYMPAVTEFSPIAREERENAIMLVWYAIAFNIILVVILSFVFWRFMIVRMNHLMNNINQFAAGEVELKPVGGGDEIDELDQRFREMAKARHSAEELRRSLQAMVSHDLRSPLTSVSLSLSLLVDKYSPDLKSEVKVIVTRLNSQVGRLVRLAESFLDLEKLQSGKLELDLLKHNVKNLIEQSVDALENVASYKNVSIQTDVSGSDDIVIDSDRITQVLVNLLSNAVKHSPRGAKIVISVRTVNSGATRFEVVDQGPGVAEVDSHKLFNRFSMLGEQPVQEAKGSGLGLYICKLLIEAHKGKIGFKTPESGSGSCFWFEIPKLESDID
ncbi:MAG: hypothetical protein K2X93_06270 [Candidatus Obscuribacterales bacterium]|nr:hypothetical protein [Candidatus Obscuribacterales bacterium]